MEKPKLLVFDDDERSARATGRQLNDHFEITIVKNQDELEDKIAETFSVILTDIRIQGTEKTGFEIVNEIRQNMRITRIPIIIYSGQITVDETRKEQGKLFFDYVDKGTIGWGDELLKKSLKARDASQKTVDYQTIKAMFKKQKLLGSPIPEQYVQKLHDYEYDTNVLNTIGDLIEQILNPELGNQEWKDLDTVIMDIFDELVPNDTASN